MRKYRFYMIAAAAMMVLQVFWVTHDNAAQGLPSLDIRVGNDIAAWQDAVFVLGQERLIKLDAHLEVVKSVQLPLTSTPLAAPSSPARQELSMAAQGETPLTDTLDPSMEGCICADQQHVYVLYDGMLYVFDHDLSHLKSKILSVR